MKFNLQELNKNQQFMKTNKETYLGISIGMFSLFLIFLITFVFINMSTVHRSSINAVTDVFCFE